MLRSPVFTTLACLMICGCADPRPTDGLQTALDEAARSMKEADAQTLHPMLDEKLTVGTSVQKLQEDLERDHAEFAHLAQQIQSPVQVVMEATVHLDGGKTLELVKEDEIWKLATPVVKSQKPTDPLEVLASFADRLEELAEGLEDSEVLAEHHSEGFLSVIETLVKELRGVAAEDLVLNEDRCYVNLPSKHKIELVRVKDGWKIHSIFPAIEFR